MIKLRNRYNFIIAVFCLLISCENKSEIKDTVQNWQGKQLVLPNDSLMVDDYKSNVNPLSKKQKIVTVINASCGVCVSELNDWVLFMQDVDTTNVGFIFLLYSIDDLITFERMNSSDINFTYPYFNDKGKNIFAKNNFPKEKNYQTFLLDSTDHVVLIGNPIKHKELTALYKSEIRKTSSSKNRSNYGYSVKTIYENNMAHLQIDDDVIFLNENGKKINKKEIKEMYEKYQIYFEQTGSKQITVRIVEAKNSK